MIIHFIQTGTDSFYTHNMVYNVLSCVQEHIVVCGRAIKPAGPVQKVRRAYLGLVWFTEWRRYRSLIQQAEKDAQDGM